MQEKTASEDGIFLVAFVRSTSKNTSATTSLSLGFRDKVFVEEAAAYNPAQVENVSCDPYNFERTRQRDDNVHSYTLICISQSKDTSDSSCWKWLPAPEKVGSAARPEPFVPSAPILFKSCHISGCCEIKSAWSLGKNASNANHPQIQILCSSRVPRSIIDILP